jgi:hypothetical protein
MNVNNLDGGLSTGINASSNKNFLDGYLNNIWNSISHVGVPSIANNYLQNTPSVPFSSVQASAPYVASAVGETGKNIGGWLLIGGLGLLTLILVNRK